jgi:hypothetical protein
MPKHKQTPDNMPTVPSVPASPEWLAKQARDYYRRSNDSHTPGSRAANRKKFISTVQQLLTLVKPETVIRAFAGGQYGSRAPAEVIAIIDSLTGQPPQPSPSSPATASGQSAAVDVSEVNRLLTAALPPLLKALKLLNPEAAQ